MDSGSGSGSASDSISLSLKQRTQAADYIRERQMIANEQDRVRADALANGQPWSLIQRYTVPPRMHSMYPPDTPTPYNFDGSLNWSSNVSLFSVYPMTVINALNDLSDNPQTSFRIAEIDGLLTAAFPEHPDMVANESFMALAHYTYDEVYARVLNIIVRDRR
jgi:hypothetical protein